MTSFRILDSDSFDSFAVCANFDDGGFDKHGKMGSYALVDGRPLCYSCASPLIYPPKPPPSRDLCGDCALLGDPGSYAPFATRYGTCVVCGSDGLVARGTRVTVYAARVMFSAGGAK